MVGEAVNVTEVPAHTGFADATIDTLTAKIGLTVTVATELFADEQIPLVTTAL